MLKSLSILLATAKEDDCITKQSVFLPLIMKGQWYSLNKELNNGIQKEK
jgi:hypothetical protein